LVEQWGARAVVADRGELAIALLSDETALPFHYVLLDTQMPGDVDGISVAQFITNHPRLAEHVTVIMMLSSAAQRGMVEQHAGKTISHYLMKPVGQAELMDALLKPFYPPAQAADAPIESITGFATASDIIRNRNVKVLLAEDNPVNQRLAIRVLEKMGYNVTLAENGIQAVAATEKQNFDLVLMDVQMPEMGGFEATARIREQGKSLPILAMTAHAIQGYREKCLRAGMDGYISKPIHVETLRKTLEEVLFKRAEHPAVPCASSVLSPATAAIQPHPPPDCASPSDPPQPSLDLATSTRQILVQALTADHPETGKKRHAAGSESGPRKRNRD